MTEVNIAEIYSKLGEIVGRLDSIQSSISRAHTRLDNLEGRVNTLDTSVATMRTKIGFIGAIAGIGAGAIASIAIKYLAP